MRILTFQVPLHIFDPFGDAKDELQFLASHPRGFYSPISPIPGLMCKRKLYARCVAIAPASALVWFDQTALSNSIVAALAHRRGRCGA